VKQERREVNDFRWRVFGGGVPDKLIAFLCECADPRCHSTALLTVEEYERRRTADAAPIVYPGHGRTTGRENVDLRAG
jgi:hypothetical protein